MKTILALAFIFALSHSAIADINRNYSNVKRTLQSLANAHSANASTFILGDSDSKDKIVGLKIGSGPTHTLVVGTHHGNEYGSTEVAIGVADHLAKSPIPGQTIYIIPVLNIGGYNARNRYEADSNGGSHDPNRDYPGPCATEGPFALKSTAALARFLETEKIISSATLHTYFPAVVYPWGMSTHDLGNAYPEIFSDMVRDATVESHYQTGNNTQIIYPADGTFEDYAYWKHGIWSILFELGYSHTPSESEIQTMVNVNVPGIVRMLANAPTQLAQNHAFTGKCDLRLQSLDRHDE